MKTYTVLPGVGPSVMITAESGDYDLGNKLLTFKDASGTNVAMFYNPAGWYLTSTSQSTSGGTLSHSPFGG